MSIRRLSPKLKDAGGWMILIGLIGLIVPMFVLMPRAAVFSGIGAFVLIIGLLLLLAHYCYYQVPAGYALLDKNGRVELEGPYFGFPPNSPKIISTSRRLVEVPNMDLETPDDGLLGASMTVSYSHDLDNAARLTKFESAEALDRAIQNRVRGALNSWAMGKPLPGTVKRAAAMQKDAEIFLLGQLSGTSQYLVPIDDSSLFLGEGMIVNDFGIRIHEINTVSWRPLADGTGKPDWGDGDHVRFDTQAIFKQFYAHTDSLSNLRKLKEALCERYPDEIEDIEDIYDQVRISMKENRDR